MAAPSKSFTIITDAEIDVDSPLTAGLFQKFRDNDIHVEEWLGLSFVAAQDHDHDGVNSAVVAAAGGGALRLIESTTIGANTASFDFSATLDGDTDEQYILAGFWRIVSSVGQQGLQLRANSANQTGLSDSTTSATQIIVVETASTSATGATFWTFIKAWSDAVAGLDSRQTLSTMVANTSGTSVVSKIIGGDFTPGVGTNITSIGLRVDDGATQIAAGSRFSLYSARRT